MNHNFRRQDKFLERNPKILRPVSFDPLSNHFITTHRAWYRLTQALNILRHYLLTLTERPLRRISRLGPCLQYFTVSFSGNLFHIINLPTRSRGN